MMDSRVLEQRRTDLPGFVDSPSVLRGSVQRQTLTEITGACDIAFRRPECFVLDLLQMRRLRVNEQFVHRRHFNAGNKSQVDPHPHARKQVHGLFGCNCLGVLQDAERAGDLIVEALPVFLDERPADAAFVSNDVRDDVLDILDDLLLSLAQRDLVRNLVKVAHCLAAFAVQPPDGQVDFVKRLEDFLDFLGEDECGQVEHDAHTHSRCRRSSDTR